MTCLTCKHWLPKKTPPAMARLRLSVCKFGESWEYLPSHASCEKFSPAPVEVQEARQKWIKEAK